MAGVPRLLTPPTGEPLSLAEAKLWANLDPESRAQDAAVRIALQAARSLAERLTDRQLVSAKYRMTLDGFPCDGAIRLEDRCPLQAVTAVQYYDASNVQQTLATSVYDVVTAREPGEICRAYGQTWPSTYRRPDAVTVDFWAGYGPVTETQAGFEAGARTVTPNSMAGIYAGTQLRFGDGEAEERIVVASVTSTTFDATFTKGHPDPCDIRPALPEEAFLAVAMLTAHWYEHRGDVQGADAERAMAAAENLLRSVWTGVYR